MKLSPNLIRAIKNGLAVVIYQDADGTHIGLIEHEVIVEARARKVTEEEAQDEARQFAYPSEAGEDYYTAGFMDTQGGTLKPDSDVGPALNQIAEMFIAED